MRAGLALALTAAAACSRAAPDDGPRPDAVTGTLTLDGAALGIDRCVPGRTGGALHLDLVTARGTLRYVPYQAAQVIWAGAPVPCTRLERSWGGGSRADGSSYFRGRIVLACGPLAGDLTADCGAITPEERRDLDAHRHELREDQRSGR